MCGIRDSLTVLAETGSDLSDTTAGSVMMDCETSKKGILAKACASPA
jgi:hypothetical protein